MAQELLVRVYLSSNNKEGRSTKQLHGVVSFEARSDHPALKIKCQGQDQEIEGWERFEVIRVDTEDKS